MKKSTPEGYTSTNFRLGLVMLDDGFKKHALETEKLYHTIYENRKANNVKETKTRTEALKEKNLQKHLTEIMDLTLDSQLERKN